MFPSLSTETPGDFSKTSIAVLPALVNAPSTLMMVLSAFLSMNGFLAVTVTMLNDFSAICNVKGLISLFRFSLFKVKGAEFIF